MKNSAIQWTDHTFNPWIGCTKVAPECKNCYAETLMDKRWGKVSWGKDQPRVRTSVINWRQPLRWDKEAKAEGVRKRVFCASLADVFDEEVDVNWRLDLFTLIAKTPNLDWLLLTKRPAAAKRFLDYGGKPPYENVWLGVSAGVDQRKLLEIPAPVHFLSCEPMLQAFDHYNLATQEFDWIIFGGESGANARPCRVEWIQDGVQFCERLGIACFVKQLGSNIVGNEMERWVTRVRHSHGGDMDEWPQELRVREFPDTIIA